MKRVRSFLSLLFLAVFALAIAPKELLHAFHDHEDTVHASAGQGVCFEEAHIHCEILQIESPVFDAPVPGFHFDVSELSFTYAVPGVVFAVPAADPFISLRGPPAC